MSSSIVAGSSSGSAAAPSAAPSRPLVGVGVLITDAEHPGCVLVGERRGSHGAKTFATPGGHLEYVEEFDECARREVKEETNLDLVDVRHVSTQNNVFPEASKHYVTLFMHGRLAPDSGELRLMEPDKCVEWVWIKWSDLQAKAATGEIVVFRPLQSLLTDATFVLPGITSAE